MGGLKNKIKQNMDRGIDQKIKTSSKSGNIPPDPDAVIENFDDGNFCVFNIKGDLFIMESTAFIESFNQFFGGHNVKDIKAVVVNFHPGTFVGSSFIGALQKTRNVLLKDNVPLILTGVQGIMAKMLGNAFIIADSIDEIKSEL